MSEAIASKEERLVRYNANIAAADKDPQLSPETGKPLSKVNTIRFGAGFLLFGVLWMSGLGIVSAVLLPMHYKTIEGADPDALVGIVNAFTAVASLVANLMFGNFSDRSRSRFGRRTPWIVFGAVLGGVTPVPDRHHAQRGAAHHLLLRLHVRPQLHDCPAGRRAV